MIKLEAKQSIRLHFSNVTGTGAVQLLKSLIPSIESTQLINISKMYVPDTGELASFQPIDNDIQIIKYNRYIPKALSRIFECTIFGSQFDCDSPILVLGDLPLRTSSRQTVFVQTPHLIKPKKISLGLNYFKFAIARLIFKINVKYIDDVIVQTEVMKDGLVETYPRIRDRIHVIPQPVPQWLLNADIYRTGRHSDMATGLSLFYPAANYPHKNHNLLSFIQSDFRSWPVKTVTLTIDEAKSPAPHVKWINCIGLVNTEMVLEQYYIVDGLLFLSKEESFGFPLVEAMYSGVPILCPDLPYAHVLCGGQAIYFDPDSIDSLHLAVCLLKNKLDNGWWPNWSTQLDRLPKSWDDVAQKMLEVSLGNKF